MSTATVSTAASHVLNRVLTKPLPLAVRGEGVWVWDAEGRQYLDAVSGGAAVSCLGHGNAEVSQAIASQLGQLAYIHGSFFNNEPVEQLADVLLAAASPNMSRVLFCSGGSEAIESALKLVRQYWLEREQPSKRRIIARRQSYHGATLGALAVSGNAARRAAYSPYLFDVHFIEPCYRYRLQRDDESVEQYALRAAKELQVAIETLGPENVAAFVAEPVVGATLGCVPAEAGYLKRIREICDQYDVLMVADEIMSGSGRAGELYTSPMHGADPDLITMAKGLGGGFQPIGAIVVSDKIRCAIEDGSGVLKHGLTYMGHPVACAAALAVQRFIAEHDVLANVRTQGDYLMEQLRRVLADHPHVGDIRGQGLFVGVELVSDPMTKQTFDPKLQLHAVLKRTALQHGLMVYPGGGTVDGVHGDHVVLAPAYTVSASEIDEIVARLQTSIDDAVAQVHKEAS